MIQVSEQMDLLVLHQSIKIKSLEHYEELGYDENTITNVVVAARNPGSWGKWIKSWNY